MDLTQLSRTVSYALRHQPDSFGLTLDPHGWVTMEELVAGLRHQKDWRSVTATDVATMVEESTKPRFEIDGGRIRARYGHSTPDRIVREVGVPPDRLFHGTNPAALDRITTDGLLPMRRQYVHLAADRAGAEAVGGASPPPQPFCRSTPEQPAPRG